MKTLNEQLADVRRDAILKALKRAQGSRVNAALELGITAPLLHRYLTMLGLRDQIPPGVKGGPRPGCNRKVVVT